MSSSATFLFADLAGFTALTEAHGDQIAADLAGDFCTRVRKLVGERGAVLKTIGDAVMVRIPLADDAVVLGQRIVSGAGGDHGLLTVRVGMHHGDAVERDGDWFGATVNLAARVAELAAGSELLLTEATWRAAGAPTHVRVAHHGTHRLRNIAAPVRVLRVLPEGERGLEIDPVCRMAVDRDQAAGRLRHESREYAFCSLECAGRFAAAPADYVADLNRERR
jgi:adenylate cyclase